MNAYAIVQAIAIAMIVAWSAWYAARRLLPTASRHAQAGVAAWFERPAHAAWLRRLGHSMRPVQASSGGCGTSGCSTCGACASQAPSARVAPSDMTADEARPLVFRERAKS